MPRGDLEGGFGFSKFYSFFFQILVGVVGFGLN